LLLIRTQVNKKGLPVDALKAVVFNDDVSEGHIESIRYPPIRRFQSVCEEGGRDAKEDDSWYKSSLITKQAKTELKHRARQESNVYSALAKIYKTQSDKLGRCDLENSSTEELAVWSRNKFGVASDSHDSLSLF
jgi:hypothetical protein